MPSKRLPNVSWFKLCPEDLRDEQLLNRIEQLARSKLAIMDGSGYIATIGHFINERGLLFSNSSYMDAQWRYLK